MKPLFQGVCTALITPFRLDFVHMEVYDQLLDRQLKAGVTALVVCGTTGESATMTDTEKLDLIGHTVDYVQGRCKVLAGTGSNCTTHAITLSKEAEKLGADGLLLVSPCLSLIHISMALLASGMARFISLFSLRLLSAQIAAGVRPIFI